MDVAGGAVCPLVVTLAFFAAILFATAPERRMLRALIVRGLGILLCMVIGEAAGLLLDGAQLFQTWWGPQPTLRWMPVGLILGFACGLALNLLQFWYSRKE